MPPMTKDAKDDRALAALSYVLFLWILPLGKRDSEFCQFHARQGMVLFVAWFVVSLLGWIPYVGWAAWLSLLVVNLMAIWKTLNGEQWDLPWLSKYAKKIKL
jgi:uncharacterized membrane protein